MSYLNGHAIGQTLEEEVAFCLLGGHGIPAEIGIAAFERLRSRGLISTKVHTTEVLSTNLREPLEISDAKLRTGFGRRKQNMLPQPCKHSVNSRCLANHLTRCART